VIRRLGSLAAAAAFAVALLAGAGTGRAYACDCAPADPEALAASADLVFIGTVTDVAVAQSLPDAELAFEPMTVTFAVEQLMKGEIGGDLVVVTTAGNSAACGVAFNVGERWQVNATLDRAEGYFTHLCSGDQLLEAGEVPASTQEGGGPPLQVLLVGGVLLAGAGFSAWAFSRGPRTDRPAT
jgi:hypothetical protein